MKGHALARWLAAGAAVVGFLGSATSAVAGRGIQADDPSTVAVFEPNICTLGASGCAGLGMDSIYAPYISGPQFFVYREGVVSFGQELPETASLAGGLASLGDGNWFAPAFGAPTDVRVYYDAGNQIRINFGPGVGNPLPPIDPEDPFEEPRSVPALFQVFLPFFFDGEAPLVDLNYADGNPPGDRQIGFHYTPLTPDLGLPPNPNVGSTDRVDLRYPGAYVGVPEPTAWALMILGFGAVGAALRRRGASTAAA